MLVAMMQKKPQESPIQIRVHDHYVQDLMDSGIMRRVLFGEGIAMAVEIGSKNKNFHIGGKRINGLVIFFSTEKGMGLSDNQLKYITDWFK